MIARGLASLFDRYGARRVRIGRDRCDRYAFRQGNFDWRIGIASGAKLLPRRPMIPDRHDETRPRSLRPIEWNPEPTSEDSVFKFTLSSRWRRRKDREAGGPFFLRPIHRERCASPPRRPKGLAESGTGCPRSSPDLSGHPGHMLTEQPGGIEVARQHPVRAAVRRRLRHGPAERAGMGGAPFPGVAITA